MRKGMKKLAVFLIGSFLLGSGGAATADVTVEMKQNEQPMTLYATEDRMATESGQGGMIFLGPEKILRMINSEKKKYTEITEADAKAMAEKIAQAQRAMASLPPALREKMAGAMKGMGGAPAPRTVKPLHQSKTINGFPTDGYVVTVEGAKGETEIWATAPGKLGVKATDLTVFKAMAEFMQQMIPGLESMKDLIKDYDHPEPDQVPGFPVLTIQKDEGGKEIWRSELVRVDHGAVPGEKFAVPAGYKQEKLNLGE
jgi:hypothetical protein